MILLHACPTCGKEMREQIWPVGERFWWCYKCDDCPELHLLAPAYPEEKA